MLPLNQLYNNHQLTHNFLTAILKLSKIAGLVFIQAYKRTQLVHDKLLNKAAQHMSVTG